MSDFALTPVPTHSRQDFAQRIQTILARGWPTRVDLAPSAANAPSGWTRDPSARVVLMLEGRQRYHWLADGQRQSRLLAPGEAIWFAPAAAMGTDWSRRCRFLGVVLRPHFLRFLIGAPEGRGINPGQSPFAHHTPLPLGEPGTLIAHALDQLADNRGDPASAGELLRALLRCARTHAERSDAVVPGKAAATWARVHEHIAATCLTETSRSATARALGLNPTYLSDLCQRHAGTGFTELVNAQRLTQARVLLRNQPELTVAAIATRCGFASAGYFARVFRQATGLSPTAWRVR